MEERVAKAKQVEDRLVHERFGHQTKTAWIPHTETQDVTSNQ
jgi:hypothetical protein